MTSCDQRVATAMHQLPVAELIGASDQKTVTYVKEVSVCLVMTNPVVTHQPGPVAYGTNVQTGEWSTGLCSCCSDIMVCALGCLCPIALGCYTANKYGENVCLACIPGGMTAMRTHMRLTYGIQGTICNDALMSFCCGLCEMCRMAREIRIRNGET
ncbi:cornifelin-like isoform X1 [Scleropages formosus]|uniref:cornifelin-like isoform X1 n=1 Tax=Scleropages formosus TaxID=113540 RepID=UPI000878F07A|nr:cornifelin-like isoform X1 [Scleropages formosus]